MKILFFKGNALINIVTVIYIFKIYDQSNNVAKKVLISKRLWKLFVLILDAHS